MIRKRASLPYSALWADASAPPGDKGFTVLEILLALAIMALVVSSVYGVFISADRSYRTQDRIADAQQAARIGLHFMVQEIRMAGLDPLGTASAGVLQAADTTVTFTADFNINGTIDETDSEKITYHLNGNTLQRILYQGTASEATQNLLDKVSSLNFSYLDIQGNSLATPVASDDLQLIKAVEIAVTVQDKDAKGKLFDRTFTTRVLCRNLSGQAA
ncbi:MAG: prepilin-type N-terminal cleavage/methylation domain-containing protein [Deltaproteobacteria bacterium]|nr:prepilin-type N-terminal cleavage/methylation domain-containing protein [Deltaproteobacteria bacterium]MBW2070408.1 prepilin-type N-terminal cleavage/methylation domain-containing protein [Deltaproteobacteria bacterium]